MPENQFGFDERVILRTGGSPSAFAMRDRDWAHLRRKIEDCPPQGLMWPSLFATGIAVAVASVIDLLHEASAPTWVLLACSVALSAVAFLGHRQSHQIKGNSTKDILDFMDLVEITGNTRDPEPSKALQSYIAKTSMAPVTTFTARSSDTPYSSISENHLKDMFAGHDPPPAAEK